jgi:CRP-like cAMP-binding protein
MSSEPALQEFLTAIHPLSEEEWMAFSANWQPLVTKRKTVLTAAGETEKYLYFVLEGIQRAFYLTDDGREATIVFTYPPSFSGVADSLLTRKPSAYFFETITASRFIRKPWEQVEQLMLTYPNIQRLILKAVSMALEGALFRQVELQCYGAEEKFKTLLRRSPHLLNLVPHKYLASYLGIDATTFSKLLGSVRL